MLVANGPGVQVLVLVFKTSINISVNGSMGAEEIKKQIRKRIGRDRKTPDQIRKKKSENGQPKSGKRTHKNQKTRRTISENTTGSIRKQGGRKSENRTNERQQKTLKWRDETRVRIPMLLETTLLHRSAALHCYVCGQNREMKGEAFLHLSVCA